MKYNMDDLLRLFNFEYGYLLDHDDDVCWYQDALKIGDEFLSSDHPAVGEFIRYRGDFLSSDREVAAFGVAFTEFLYG